jgi:hypothetical protein
MEDDGMTSTPDPEQLHVIMAGDGNPYAVLSARRRQLLFLANQNHSFNELSQLLSITREELRADIDMLRDYSLVLDGSDAHEHVTPTFLIASAKQVLQVTALASEIGRELAQRLLDHWTELEEAYPNLHMSKKTSFENAAFLIVGDLILDVGLLSALAKDATLMPKAPTRPSPDRPDARYYVWMIEGKAEDLGRYGQRASALPWKSWLHITYGQYWIDGRLNEAREAHDDEAKRALESADSPSALAAQLNIPFLNEDDTIQWGQTMEPHTQRLVDVYLSAESRLKECFHDLTTAGVFAEFFCWLDHLAYGHAIDALAEEGVLEIPFDRFAAAIVHESASHF